MSEKVLTLTCEKHGVYWQDVPGAQMRDGYDTICPHCGQDTLRARISDLEAEVTRLRDGIRASFSIPHGLAETMYFVNLLDDSSAVCGEEP